MYQSLYPRPRRGRDVLFVVGWFLAVVAGIGLAWYGFTWTEESEQSEDVSSSAGSPTPTQMAVWPTATPFTPSPTLPPVLPTATPLPIATTAVLATPTTAVAFVVAGEQGVNVRAGPGTNYTRLGYLEPGAQAELIGRYSDWWQIRYEGAPAWVFGELVTAPNADSVPQVQLPSPPTAAPAAAPTSVPTQVPPTQPPADFRGLLPEDYQVEGAPGPYAVNKDICFNMWITNNSGKTFEYDALGTWVQETGQFQKSYFAVPPDYPHFTPGQRFSHRDCIEIPEPGTYNLWLAIHFTDGTPALLKGPVQVIVQ